MDWSQIAVMMASNAALFFWSRAESRQDIRHLDNKMDAIRELTHAIHLEMKDFHGRLCDIEKNRGKK